ncbi:uncharacterized protein EV422DRAFT_505845 [Fimicolochytrium jonesii]|uniref:uncharacterized protein n=1 Tax=Fimicolochytrium jonesii TaxID=1396493 RepID=UPI0022FE320E|nr:uncharacterized protein EV422DRAFT_505845 [Fimicolochytrium jonesii]KAI8821747.1 hypothetical protein EV422DRAFT_505845 [Fimicolochytrium jonesii]
MAYRAGGPTHAYPNYVEAARIAPGYRFPAPAGAAGAYGAGAAPPAAFHPHRAFTPQRHPYMTPYEAHLRPHSHHPGQQHLQAAHMHFAPHGRLSPPESIGGRPGDVLGGRRPYGPPMWHPGHPGHERDAGHLLNGRRSSIPDALYDPESRDAHGHFPGGAYPAMESRVHPRMHAVAAVDPALYHRVSEAVRRGSKEGLGGQILGKQSNSEDLGSNGPSVIDLTEDEDEAGDMVISPVSNGTVQGPPNPPHPYPQEWSDGQVPFPNGHPQPSQLSSLLPENIPYPASRKRKEPLSALVPHHPLGGGKRPRPGPAEELGVPLAPRIAINPRFLARYAGKNGAAPPPPPLSTNGVSNAVGTVKRVTPVDSADGVNAATITAQQQRNGHVPSSIQNGITNGIRSGANLGNRNLQHIDLLTPHANHVSSPIPGKPANATIPTIPTTTTTTTTTTKRPLSASTPTTGFSLDTHPWKITSAKKIVAKVAPKPSTPTTTISTEEGGGKTVNGDTGKRRRVIYEDAWMSPVRIWVVWVGMGWSCDGCGERTGEHLEEDGEQYGKKGLGCRECLVTYYFAAS